jgi:hypothetical protein
MHITFRHTQDIDTARMLWEALSPYREIDDEWDFRYTFFKYLHYNIYFIAGFDGSKLIGLLPLQYNASYGLKPPYAPRMDGFFEFFGGDDTDNNDVFLLPGYERYRIEFFRQINRQAVLAPLSASYGNFPQVKPYATKYILPLSDYTSYEDFLADRMDSKKRGALRRQIRNLYRDYRIQVIENNPSDLELLFDLSKKRFGPESSFHWEYRQKIYYDLAKLFESVTLSIVVDGVMQAAALGIVYNGTYLDMNAVANPEIANLGKLLTFIQINKAIERKANIFDAGKGDSGWKEQFHLEHIPQYRFAVTPTFAHQPQYV